MPRADVVVVGAGLAGLATALELATRGARVLVLAKGHASTHWIAGTLDVAAPLGAATPRAGVDQLAATPGHPYAVLGPDVAPALESFRRVVAADGLPYVGDLDMPIRPLPTGIGGTRPAAIVPDAQAAALAPWAPDEALVVCGIAGFKDFWPAQIATSLARRAVWSRSAGAEADGVSRDVDGKHAVDGPARAGVADGLAPARVVGVSVNLPGVADRHNLTALHLARAFDDPLWRRAAIDVIARAVDAARAPSARVALPAVLGLRDHAAVLGELRARLGRPVMEVPLVPPSIPGMRVYDAYRTALRKAGARIQLGESVSRTEVADGRVTIVATPAAVREFVVRADSVVIATGGLTGGGIVGRPDGTLAEAVLGLPVETPERVSWFSADPFSPQGHPIEGAGIRTDGDLRPVGGPGGVVLENVRVVGSALAGQRWLRERCGEGVALASAHRAAASIAEAGFTAGPPLRATSDTTSAQVRAAAPAAVTTAPGSEPLR